MSARDLAAIVRSAHRRIVEARLMKEILGDSRASYEAIRREYWMFLIEEEQL